MSHAVEIKLQKFNQLVLELEKVRCSSPKLVPTSMRERVVNQIRSLAIDLNYIPQEQRPVKAFTQLELFLADSLCGFQLERMENLKICIHETRLEYLENGICLEQITERVKSLTPTYMWLEELPRFHVKLRQMEKEGNVVRVLFKGEYHFIYVGEDPSTMLVKINGIYVYPAGHWRRGQRKNYDVTHTPVIRY